MLKVSLIQFVCQLKHISNVRVQHNTIITNEYLPASYPAQRSVGRPPDADPIWRFAHAQSLDVAEMRGVSIPGLLTP